MLTPPGQSSEQAVRLCFAACQAFVLWSPKTLETDKPKTFSSLEPVAWKILSRFHVEFLRIFRFFGGCGNCDRIGLEDFLECG